MGRAWKQMGLVFQLSFFLLYFPFFFHFLLHVQLQLYSPSHRKFIHFPSPPSLSPSHLLPYACPLLSPVSPSLTLPFFSFVLPSSSLFLLYLPSPSLLPSSFPPPSLPSLSSPSSMPLIHLPYLSAHPSLTTPSSVFPSGTIPKEASFAMQAMLTNHFTYGGFYPVGGSSQIAFNIIPTIEAAGGRVLVRARVSNILMDDNQQRVVGVTVRQGHTLYDIMAPFIISDAGIMNTFNSLLPSSAVKKFGINKSILSRARHGMALISVFIGLDASKEELGLKPSNVWAFEVRKAQSVCVCVCVYIRKVFTWRASTMSVATVT